MTPDELRKADCVRAEHWAFKSTTVFATRRSMLVACQIKKNPQLNYKLEIKKLYIKHLSSNDTICIEWNHVCPHRMHQQVSLQCVLFWPCPSLSAIGVGPAAQIEQRRRIPHHLPNRSSVAAILVWACQGQIDPHDTWSMQKYKCSQQKVTK